MRDTFVVACDQNGTISPGIAFVHKFAMPQRDEPRHNLRLTPDLKARLAHAAIDAGRSMNAEILARLEKSFVPDPAAQIVELLRPVAGLSDDDRRAVGQLVAKLGALLAIGSGR